MQKLQRTARFYGVKTMIRFGLLTQMYSYHTRKYRWADEVEEGLKIMGRRNWRAVVRDRKERRRVLAGAKVHKCL